MQPSSVSAASHLYIHMRIAMSLVLCGLLSAQEPVTETTLRVDVDIVNLLFAVRDKKGALIANLTQKDFEVLEDGKPQTVKYFSRETDLPLTVGLLVDVSRSQERLIEEERATAAQFFREVLKPKDMAFLISFGSEAELLQDSTNAVKLLQAGLDQMRPMGGVSGIHPGPVPTVGQPRGTIMYDAVSLAATEQLKREVGRKAIVLITDGVDQGSRYTLREAIDAAHRSDVIIYSIYYTDPMFYNSFGYGGGDGDLKKMSEETGGRLFRVGRKTPLSDIFKQIQEEMRSQYALAYTPSNTNNDGAFRKLEIKTPNNKDLRVQARKGRFAVPSERN